MRFNYTELSRRAQEWISSRGYSDILKGIVLNLLEIKDEDRLRHDEIWAILAPHRHEIRERKNFIITNATDKIHQAVAKYRLLRSGLGQPATNKITSMNRVLETSTVVRH